MRIRRVLVLGSVVLVALVIASVLFFATFGRSATTAWFGEARVHAPTVEEGQPVSAMVGVRGNHTPEARRRAGVSGAMLDEYASRPLPVWEEKSKVEAPRVMLAKLMTEHDIAAVNTYLMALSPTAPSGSSWELRPRADYDFTEIVLAMILMEFRDRPSRLWPEAADHIVDELIIEVGYSIRWTVPGSLGMVQETENHILMTETTRYLRNLWMIHERDTSEAHKRRTTNHADALAAFIEELDASDMFEFNSQPYSGYSLAALLAADAFAEHPRLKTAARRLLDRLSYQFAAGSHRQRRAVPFRRQTSRGERRGLFEDPMTAASAAWFGFVHPELSIEALPNKHHGVIAAAMPYRPGGTVHDLTAGRRGEAMVRIGRGTDASPEIHSFGDGFHLSAGGAGFGPTSGIVVRPTVLFVEDRASTLDELFFLPGAGDDAWWNCTGVYRRLAVGPARPHVPGAAVLLARADGLKLYTLGETFVVVGEGEGFGLVYVPREQSLEVFDQIVEANRDKSLREWFVDELGVEYRYSVDAPVGQWLFTEVAGQELDRDYGSWPRLTRQEFLSADTSQ